MDDNMLLRSLLENSDEGIVAIDEDGIITAFNHNAAHILERNAQDIMGQPFMHLFGLSMEENAFANVIFNAVNHNSRAGSHEVDYYTERGTRRLRLRTVPVGEKRGAVVLMQDITKQRDLQQVVAAMKKLKDHSQRLESRNKLLSRTFAQFSSYTIMRQLLDTPDGLAMGGKKRRLTVLMSDLRGFTALSERMEAAELLTMLNHYLAAMTEITSRHNGTIIEFTGDGIFVLFGAPLPSKTHAADAVAAAIEMQATMEDVNRWNAQNGYPDLAMGIGINTGEVVVGNIGSRRHSKYGVVGSTVNLCGRIESYTIGGQILIGPMTRELIEAPLEIVQQQEVFPKGAETPLLVSQVSGIGAPYDLRYDIAVDKTVILRNPVEVEFFVIHEKHCVLTPSHGRLIGLSDTAALLETDVPLRRFDDIQMICGGGKVFAKVMRHDEQRYTLHFTAKEPSFAVWRKEQK